MPLETIINSPDENKQHINEPYQTPGVNNLRLFFEHKGMNSVNSCANNTHKSYLMQHDKSISSANYTKKNNVQHDLVLQNVSHVKSQQHLNQPQHYDTCHKSNIPQKTSEYEQQAHPHVEHQYSVEEEQQLPVLQLLRKFGGDARVRKLDHFDEKKTHKRTTSVRSIDEITNEDFVPPTSPLISVPRLPFTNRKSTDQVCPEPTSRKSYVTHASLETRPNCSEEQNIRRKSVILCPSLITEV
uniref:Uncharacterized protein n=1 Tax=Heterorhabditis bacteriophora TaxID=37862 RepID=A0A1I7XCQ2_HETBA